MKWLLPTISEWWRLRKLTSNLLGNWVSHYQGIDEPPETWVTETLTFSLDFFRGQLLIKNADSSEEYNYTAYGEIKNNIHIIGHWISQRSGANAHGCFVQTISAQGNCMYGYWVGPDKTQARRYGRWVVARDESGISLAKKLIEDMRKPYAPNTSQH
ncbi:MAG: hypothetical protein AB4290_24455 [Spirulina sp.]